jgi:hypothetical protein
MTSDKKSSLKPVGKAIGRMATPSLLLLYAANSFLFLLLSFFFLPDSIVKVVGSAAAVVLGLLGLKGLNPREASSTSFVAQHRTLVIVVLSLAALLQAVVLRLGFAYPCRIVAIPGSTVMVDGKFFARTPDPTPEPHGQTAKMYSPDNIRPWLTPQENKYLLRWDTHEIRISKKWYVDARDRSEESVMNVSVSLVDLLKLWKPKQAFADWVMKADQKPLLKISYGIKEQPAEEENLPLARELAQELQLAVEDWDRLWLKAMDQKDDVPHNRTEPYVAALQVVQDHDTAHVEFQIRDWTDHALKALQPILDITPDHLNTPLEKIRNNVFSQLLDELAIRGEAIRLSEATNTVAKLTQNLRSSVSASTGTPEIPAEGPSATPGLTATLTASATPTLPATAIPNSIQVVDQLQSVATEAVNKNQLDVALAVKKQLQATLNNVQTQRASKQTPELVERLERANGAIKTAIKSKSGKGRIYIQIANESQREPARKLQGILGANNQFLVIGIQNVGGRAYIPDTAEVRYFADPPTTKQSASDIVETLKKNGVSKVRPSYVIPSEREKKVSSDIETHFEIWFARDSFAKED